jgi:hypothetical protein
MASKASINFIGRDSGDDAWIGVRVEGDDIGLATSLKMNGDLEVFFGVVEAEALRDALAETIETTGG